MNCGSKSPLINESGKKRLNFTVNEDSHQKYLHDDDDKVRTLTLNNLKPFEESKLDNIEVPKIQWSWTKQVKKIHDRQSSRATMKKQPTISKRTFGHTRLAEFPKIGRGSTMDVPISTQPEVHVMS
jgi:hypothetical protein